MKYIIIYALLVFSLISCKIEKSVDYVIISGKITNNMESTITLKSRNTIDTLMIDSNGNFNDTIKIVKPSYFRLGKEGLANLGVQLYLDKGNDIQVAYNTKEFASTLTITGKGSETTNYLYEKMNLKTKTIGKISELYKLNENQYKLKIADLKSKLISLIEAKNNISEDFKVKEKRNIHYDYLYRLKSFENGYKKYSDNSNFKVSANFLDELKELSYNSSEDYLFSIPYAKLVKQYYEGIAEEKLKNNITLPVGITYLEVYGTITNKIIRNSLLFNSAKILLNSYYIENLSMFYNTFLNYSTNVNHKKQISKIYNNLKLIDKGQVSPTFTNYENYLGGTTSLNDFKGKFVYIDVWATWCIPCKNEFPFLKKLEETYHDRNIVFVSISTDKLSAKKKWRKMVVDEALTGIQLFAQDSFNSEFIQAYQINSIPRFILINPEGKIISANAPRPSNKKLIALLNENNI